MPVGVDVAASSQALSWQFNHRRKAFVSGGAAGLQTQLRASAALRSVRLRLPSASQIPRAFPHFPCWPKTRMRFALRLTPALLASVSRSDPGNWRPGRSRRRRIRLPNLKPADTRYIKVSLELELHLQLLNRVPVMSRSTLLESSKPLTFAFQITGFDDVVPGSASPENCRWEELFNADRGTGTISAPVRDQKKNVNRRRAWKLFG